MPQMKGESGFLPLRPSRIVLLTRPTRIISRPLLRTGKHDATEVTLLMSLALSCKTTLRLAIERPPFVQRRPLDDTSRREQDAFMTV